MVRGDRSKHRKDGLHPRQDPTKKTAQREKSLATIPDDQQGGEHQKGSRLVNSEDIEGLEKN